MPCGPGLDLPLRDWDEGIVAQVALERALALAHGQDLGSLLLQIGRASCRERV